LHKLKKASILLLMETNSKKTTLKFKVVCMECGRKFSTSSTLPSCSKCGSSDIEVA